MSNDDWWVAFFTKKWDEKSSMPPCNKLAVKDLEPSECILEIIYEKAQLINAATIDAEYRAFSGYVTWFISYTCKDLTKSQAEQMSGAGNALEVIACVDLALWKQ